MTIATKSLPQYKFRCCNSCFMKHLRSKRLWATTMYTPSRKKLRTYYNHILEEQYKKQGLKKLFKYFFTSKRST